MELLPSIENWRVGAAIADVHRVSTNFTAQIAEAAFDTSEIHGALIQIGYEKACFYVFPALRVGEANISGSHYSVQRDSQFELTSPTNTVSYENYKAEAVRQVCKLSAKWHESLLNSTSDSSSKALALTSKFIFESMIRFGPSSIDLIGLKPEIVNPMHLAVILRITKNRKSLVAGWDDACNVARAALRLQKIPEDVVLVGIA